MSQLTFSFQQQEKYLEDDFVILDENLVAHSFLEKFFAQRDFASSPIQSLILKGQKASGKTHLLNIFTRKFGGEFVDQKKQKEFLSNHFYVFEDFEKIDDEEFLFHLINSAKNSEAFLVLSLGDEKKFKLKDLNSRLKNIVTVEIKNPGIKALEQLLINRLARRQIKPSSKSIKSALSKIESNYSAIDEALNLFI